MKINFFYLSLAIFYKSNRKSRLLLVSFFFLLFFLTGLSVYPDYGISWDEPVQRMSGMITLKYLGERFAPDWAAQDEQLQQYHTPLSEYLDRDYGVVFEAPVSLLERVFDLNDPQDIYLLRHLLTFLVCFLGVFAFFQLVERRFSDWRLGLLGALLMILSPRFFAESFYNSKDAVFMALFTISINTAVRFLLNPTHTSAYWHALFSAIAIDVRVVGIISPVVTVTVFLLRLVRCEVAWRTSVPALAIYIVLTPVFVIALWPYLWAAPWTNFLQALANMSQFRWNGIVLYLGVFQHASDLPWHYILVWISISTPLFYVFLFLVGAGGILFQLARRHWLLWQDDTEWQDLLFLGIVIAPLLMVIILDSVLYDGWRQMYFIYPMFLIVVVRGWVILSTWNTGKLYSVVIILITMLALIQIAVVMFRTHPYQNVYFNFLAGRDVKTQFEVDYWGLSNRQALELILKHDSRPLITIWPASWTPLIYSTLMLNSHDRQRINVVNDQNKADYIINNYRGIHKTFSLDDRIYDLVYEIKVNGQVINSIFKKI